MREYLPCQKLQRKRKVPIRPPVRVHKLQRVDSVRHIIPVPSVWDICEKKTFFVFASRLWSFPSLVLYLGLPSSIKRHGDLITVLTENSGSQLAAGWQHLDHAGFEEAIYAWHYWLQHLWLNQSDKMQLRLVYHKFFDAFRHSDFSDIVSHVEHHVYLDGFLLLLMSLAVRGELNSNTCFTLLDKLHKNLSSLQFQTTVQMILQQLSVMEQKGALQVVRGVLSTKYADIDTLVFSTHI